MRRTVALFAFLACLCAGAALAEPPSNQFGRLFPDLAPLEGATPQQLADLAQTMLDPGTLDLNNGVFGTGVPSGFTYFGQFVDHDLTLDPQPQPSGPIDPTTLTNGRSFKLDLDSVYGGGPKVSPQLYAEDMEHFLVQEPNDNGVDDLPRNEDGSAILVEGRNDENQIISQIHIAFLKAHNRLIDEGDTFAKAKKTLTQSYQWAVVHDLLGHILMPGTKKLIQDQKEEGLAGLDDSGTPVEFTAAAFRFGHSQVREQYFINDDLGVKLDVFSATGGDDLSGGKPLQEDHFIEWNYFFPELQDLEDDEDISNANISRLIDTKISKSLFTIPIPGAEATGSNVLPFRTLTREQAYGLPSGQDVAEALGLPVIPPEEFDLGPAFEEATPLFIYILAESEKVTGGKTLGPVGSIIVGASFVKALNDDHGSYVHITGFKPDEEIAGADGALSVSDILVFGGVAQIGVPVVDLP